MKSIIEVDKLTDFFANRQSYDNSNRKPSFEKNRVSYSQPIFEPANEPRNNSKSNYSNTKFLSATSLSKELGISSKDLAYKIEKLGWIERRDKSWGLTRLGISKGAEMKKGQYGEYIAYPETVIRELKQ